MDTSVFHLLHSRIISHYDSAKKIIKGEMPAPRTAIFYPTYVCNQDCPGCEYAHENYNIGNMMTKDQMINAIDQLAALGIKGLEFCGGGEPTLHPNMIDAILRLKDHNISIGLLTNGTKLYGDLARVAVENLSYIRISIDAADEETFNHAKKPKSKTAGYDQVISNIKELVRIRKEINSQVTISLKYLVSNLNVDGLEAAAELAQNLEVDSIQFKGVRVFKNLMTQEQEKSVKERIANLNKKYSKLAVVGSIDKIDLKMKCWLSPVQTMIDPLGDVYICCYYRHRKEKHCLGNLFQESMHDIWYSQKHWDVIDKIEIPECNVLDCRFAIYNEIMSKMMIEDSAQLDFI